MRALARLGINIVNRDNVLDYFNLYDYDRTGRIKYKDFITEVFTPIEMKRRKILEEDKAETKDENKIPQKKERERIHSIHEKAKKIKDEDKKKKQKKNQLKMMSKPVTK